MHSFVSILIFVLSYNIDDGRTNTPSHTKTKKFPIFIQLPLLSSNDNRPVFEKHRCAGYLSRQAAVGSQLVVLSAIDFDTSDIISYRITEGNRDDCFRLDGRSGRLTLNCDLNQRRGTVARSFF